MNFDNVNVSKGFKLTDSITDQEIEIATFNAVMIKDSNINIFMNVNNKNLYLKYKNDILNAYADFNAEIAALGLTMNLTSEAAAAGSDLKEYESYNQALYDQGVQFMKNIIKSIVENDVN